MKFVSRFYNIDLNDVFKWPKLERQDWIEELRFLRLAPDPNFFLIDLFIYPSFGLFYHHNLLQKFCASHSFNENQCNGLRQFSWGFFS